MLNFPSSINDDFPWPSETGLSSAVENGEILCVSSNGRHLFVVVVGFGVSACSVSMTVLVRVSRLPDRLAPTWEDGAVGPLDEDLECGAGRENS